jgi:hypothetical protein
MKYGNIGKRGRRMRTAKEMYKYARVHKLGFNWTWFIGSLLQKKHFKLVEQGLLDNEEVLVSFIGRHKPEEGINSPFEGSGKSEHHEKVHYKDTEGFYAYAITTEQRLVYAHWKPFHHDAMNIPLSNINNVNPDTGMIWGSVKVETFGDSFSIFWTKNVVHRIAKEIQKGMSDAKDGYMDGVTASNRTQKVASATGAPTFDDLEKAKNSLDKGLITQEEYDQFKKRVIG